MDNESPNVLLQEAHAKLCARALEIAQKEDATVQELKFVREFLRDNHINSARVPGSQLDQAASAAEDANIIKLQPNYTNGDILDEDDPVLDMFDEDACIGME